MSQIDNAISYVFTWQGIIDNHTCAKCKRLIGRQYRDQDLFQDVLWDSFEGDIFDLNRGVSLAHGGGSHFCRCTVTVDVIVDVKKTAGYIDLVDLLGGFGIEQ